MAGSLVQTSTVEAGVSLEEGGRAQWNMRRFRFIAGALHILCRLILVSCAVRPNQRLLYSTRTPLDVIMPDVVSSCLHDYDMFIAV